MSDEIKKDGKKTPLIVLGVICVAAIVGAVIYLVLDGIGVIGKKDQKATGGDADKPGSSVVSDYRDKVIKVGDYKNFSYDAFVEEVTDEELADYYEDVLTYCKQVGLSYYEKDDSRDGTEIKDGDTVNIDYTGYLDGEAFEGGADTGFDLTIGSNRFIDGFESSLVGKKVGETVDINVTFPDPYDNNPDMAGKPVVFTVKINYIGKEIELTPDNIYNLVFNFTSKEEMEQNVIKDMLEMKRQSHEIEMQENYINHIVEGSEFADLTKEAEDYAGRIISMLEQNVTSMGYDFSQYITSQYQFGSVDEYKAALQKDCLDEIKRSGVLNVISDTENIVMSEDDFNSIALEVISDYNSTDVAAYQSSYDEMYGQGAFRQYMFDIYAIETLFDKYAVEKPAIATGADAE